MMILFKNKSFRERENGKMPSKDGDDAISPTSQVRVTHRADAHRLILEKAITK
jgi:hypothetical protein